jgi:hypothetical protein
MNIAVTNTKPQREAAADRAIYFVCDAAFFLALSTLAVVHTVAVWLPLCLLDHFRTHLCTRNAQSSGARP